MSALIFLTALVPRQASVDLAADARLKSSISIRSAAETCGAVCKKLSDATHVAIKPLDYMKDDLIVMYVKEKPAYEVLTQLADHFGWEWVKEGDGYQLRMPSGAADKERASVSKEIIAPYLEEQKKVAEELKKPLMSAEESAKKSQEIRAQLDKLMEQNESAWPEMAKLQAQLDQLTSDSSFTQRFLKQCFVNLTPAQLEQIDLREKLVFSYYPTRAQLGLGSMSSAAAQLVAEIFAARDKLFAGSKDEESGGKFGRRLDYYNEGYGLSKTAKPEDVWTVRVIFRRSPNRFFGSTRSSELVLLTKSLKVLYRSGMDDGFRGMARYLADAAQREKGSPEDEIVKQLPDKLSSPTPELKERFSPIGLMKSLLPVLFGNGFNQEPLSGEAEREIMLAEAAGVALIGDAYDSHLSYLASGRGMNGLGIDVNASVGSLFAHMAEEMQSKATYKDGWVKLRTRNWELERASSAPRSILTKFGSRLRENGGVSIDDYIHASTQLTDLQARSPFLNEFLSFGSTSGSAGLYFMRGLAYLSSAQRAALEEGRPVPYNSLSQAARNAFGEYLYRSEVDGSGGISIGIIPSFFGTDTGEDEELDRMAGGAEAEKAAAETAVINADDESMDAMLDSAEDDMAWEEEAPDDREITQVLPDGPLPGATLSLELKSNEAVSALLDFGGIPVPVIAGSLMFAMLTSEDMSAGSPVPISVKGVRSGHIDSYLFTLQASKDMDFRFTFSSGSAVGKFGEEADLPKAIRDRLTKARKAADQMRSRRDVGGEPPPPPAKN